MIEGARERKKLEKLRRYLAHTKNSLRVLHSALSLEHQ